MYDTVIPKNISSLPLKINLWGGFEKRELTNITQVLKRTRIEKINVNKNKLSKLSIGFFSFF
jgi:hypothetical protein